MDALDATCGVSCGDALKAAELALTLGASSLCGAMAAVVVGGLISRTESGRRSLPWGKSQNRIHSPLTSSEWDRAFDSTTGRMRGGGQKAIGRVRLGGCSESLRGEVWPFLLGLYDSNSTSTEREEDRREREKKYRELRGLARAITRRAVEEEEEKVRREEMEREERERKVVLQSALEEEGVWVEMKGGEGEVKERQDEEEGGVDEDEESEPLLSGDADDELLLSGGADDELLHTGDAVDVSFPPSMQTSTESFVDVAHSEVTEEVIAKSSGNAGSRERLSEERINARECDSEADTESVPLLEPVEGSTKGIDSTSKMFTQEGGQSYKDCLTLKEDADVTTGWSDWGGDIPEVFERKGRNGESALESFLVWRRIMRLDAVRMNEQWVPFSAQLTFPEEDSKDLALAAELKNHEHLTPAQRTHAARLVSILEAYAVHDPEIGYCQGMTDLLSPFVTLLLDDSEAFWCFARFMETSRNNFRTDEVGIRKQLDLVARILEVCDPEVYRHLGELGAQDCIFVYRMVIVLLRRELSFKETITLWEVLWAEAAAAAATDSAAAAASSVGASVSIGRGPYSLAPARPDLILFVIAAIVVSHRDTILQCEGLDEVLRHCNSLAGQLDIWDLVCRARGLVSILSSSEQEDED